MVGEREPVPIDVAARVDELGEGACGRGHAGGGGGAGNFDGRLGGVGHTAGVGDAGVGAGVDAAHGEPAEGLAVAARLEAGGALVQDGEVADVGVAAEELNGGAGVLGADGVEDGGEGAAAGGGAGGVVAEDEEEVDGLGGGGDGAEEPGLLHEGFGLDDLGDVRVAGEVVQDAEGHNAQAVRGREVAGLLPDVLELARGVVEDLYVAGEVLGAVVLAELGEGQLGHAGQVELVVADGQHVVGHVLEDGVRQRPVRVLGVAVPVAVVEVPGVCRGPLVSF